MRKLLGNLPGSKFKLLPLAIFLLSFSVLVLLFSSFIILAPSAQAQTTLWEEVYNGPLPLESSRFTFLVPHPDDPHILFLGTNKGIFKSVDDGGGVDGLAGERHWDTFAFAQEWVSALAFDPHDPQTMYAGLSSGSVWKSSDNGQSWQLLSVTPHYSALSIRISASVPGLVYVQDNSRIHRSLDGGLTWQSGAGVNTLHDFDIDSGDSDILYAAAGGYGFKRSVDGGLTWEQIDLFCGWAAGCSQVYELASVPDRPGEVLVVHHRSASSGDTLYKYTFSDTLSDAFSNTLPDTFSDTLSDAFSDSDWTRQTVLEKGRIWSLTFDNENRGYVITKVAYYDYYSFYQSGPEGESWQEFDEEMSDIRGNLMYSSSSNSLYLAHLTYDAGVYYLRIRQRSLSSIISDADLPILLVPGLGASVSPRMFSDTAADTWGYMPGAKGVYRGLISSLANSGYTQGDNLEVVFYDWRGHLDDSACSYLKPKINEVKERTGASHVRLVGHSMGGLVSRMYVQSNCYGDDVSRVVTVGSPHEGSVDAYYAWGGGDLRIMGGAAQRAASMYISYLSKKDDTTWFEALKSNIPSLQEILPTFNFLEDQVSGEWKPFASLTESRNDFLAAKNEQIPSFLNNITLTTLAGMGIETRSGIVVQDRPWYERDKWADGVPVSDIFTDEGDNRVLAQSALINLYGASTVWLSDSNHSEIVTETSNQQQILLALGIPSVALVPGETEAEEYLSIFLGSPATLLVTDPNGNQIGWKGLEYINQIEGAELWGQEAEVKWLVIPNPLPGDYQARVIGTGVGEYHLLVDYYGPESEDDQEVYQEAYQEVLGTIIPGQTDTVNLRLNAISSPDPANPPHIIPSPLQLIDPDGALQTNTIATNLQSVQDYIFNLSLPLGVSKPLEAKLALVEKLVIRSQKLLAANKPRPALVLLGQALVTSYQTRQTINTLWSIGLINLDQALTYKHLLQSANDSLSTLYDQIYEQGNWPNGWDRAYQRQQEQLREQLNSLEEQIINQEAVGDRLELLAETFSLAKEQTDKSGTSRLVAGKVLVGELTNLLRAKEF